MDRVHLLNNPFTFQAMEKHAAYCAMIRLGLKVPETWMLPNKTPPDNPRFQGTAERYLRYFDLEAVARAVGMPLYMKPFDGGAWVGVSRVENTETLYRAYDESEQRLMHLQASVDGYDVFARSLGIGAESIVLHFHPEKPMHDRYSVDHSFLTRSSRRRGPHDPAHRQRVLPLGAQQLRDADPGRRRLSDRLRKRHAGPRAYQPPLLLPLGDQKSSQVGRVLLRHGPSADRGSQHREVLQDRRPRGFELRGEARRDTASSPTSSSTSTGIASSAKSTSRTSTSCPWPGWRAPTSTGSSSTRSRTPSPPTSTSSSSRTSEGCSAPGPMTNE